MKKISSLVVVLFGALTASAQVNLANFDFNGSTGIPVSAATTTTNITASINGTQSNAAYSGTATGSGAFVQNTTAGNALSMSNSSGTNTNYWTLTLGGSDLNKYMNYKVYFQSEHSSTGATGIAIFYSTDGSTFTALSQTVSPGLNSTYTEATVDLSGVSVLNNQAAVYIRFAANGGTSSTGTLRIDNLQIQAALSPWTMSGGNVNFTGGITATSFTTTGDAKINGSLIAGGLTSNSSSLNVTTPVVFSNTLKNTTLAGTGSRLLLTDATGLISPLAAGTSSQVLYGNGTWAVLPASTFTASGSNAYFTGGNLGVGTTSPAYPLDVNGISRLGGNTNVKGNLDAVSLSFQGGAGTISYVPANGSQGDIFNYARGGTTPPPVTLTFPCTQNPVLNANTSHRFLGNLQAYGYTNSNNLNILTMSFDGANGIIDMAGTNSAGNPPNLLINYYCGKDVAICTNTSNAGGTNNAGGVVSVGQNFQIGTF